MKEQTYYKAVEYFADDRCMTLSLKDDKGDWFTKFKTYEEAKRAVDHSITCRKNQYFYWRGKDNKIIDKISYWERYPVHYKIFKVIEQKEELFYCDNSDVKLREPNNEGQEETTL